MRVSQLPLPHLEARQLEPLHIVTDDALAQQTGVRVAFSGRAGGVSVPPHEGLNLGSHVGDDLGKVAENRRMLLRALDADGCELVVPNQVHGTRIVRIDQSDADSVEAARSEAAQGADGLFVEVSDVAALLCFADCVPVVIVSPTGAFSVVHAGWRGAVGHIASRAVRMMAQREAAGGACGAGSASDEKLAGSDGLARSGGLSKPGELTSSGEPPFSSPEEAAASYNVYVGPYIHAECFETGLDVAEAFSREIGSECVDGSDHVDLGRALRIDLACVGIRADRIADAGVCTACHPDVFYSYRASGGTCGRHGALAFRRD